LRPGAAAIPTHASIGGALVEALLSGTSTPAGAAALTGVVARPAAAGAPAGLRSPLPLPGRDAGTTAGRARAGAGAAGVPAFTSFFTSNARPHDGQWTVPPASGGVAVNVVPHPHGTLTTGFARRVAWILPSGRRSTRVRTRHVSQRMIRSTPTSRVGIGSSVPQSQESLAMSVAILLHDLARGYARSK
jgi:hypothetical protein